MEEVQRTRCGVSVHESSGTAGTPAAESMSWKIARLVPLGPPNRTLSLPCGPMEISYGRMVCIVHKRKKKKKSDDLSGPFSLSYAPIRNGDERNFSSSDHVRRLNGG